MIGVDRIRPIGPQMAVQNIAARISDSVDRPVVAPYSQGSMTLLLMTSSVTISASAHSTMSQPGSTAKASVSGNTAPMIGPT